MYELKTKLNDASVIEFLENVDNKRRKEDSFVVLDMMSEITGEEPKMWGTSIIGFGKYHYKTKSGIESDWMRIGFSPRKQNLTLYIMDGHNDHSELLSKLGKHKLGKACLYINKLDDINLEVLTEIIKESYDYVSKNY